MAFIEEPQTVLTQLPTHHIKIWYETITQTHDRHIFQLTSVNEGLDKINNGNRITKVKSAMSKEIYLTTLKHFDAVYFLEEITLKLGAIWWMQKLRTHM